MKWILTNDRMPEDNVDVLVYVPDWDLIQVGHYSGRVWIIENQTPIVIHWMELPYSPEELK